MSDHEVPPEMMFESLAVNRNHCESSVRNNRSRVTDILALVPIESMNTIFVMDTLLERLVKEEETDDRD